MTDPTLSQEEQAEKEFANAGVFGEYNVLLLGIDSRTERGLEAEITAKSYRTDTMILATLDIKNKKAKLISIPRDTKVKVKGNYNKINAAFVYGGIELAKETVENFAGVRIDRTMVVDFQSLVKFVDLLGGIEIDVPVRMYRPTERYRSSARPPDSKRPRRSGLFPLPWNPWGGHRSRCPPTGGY
jgi:anionic cell wall polymer biosynthesis LytR-Cps2A-Psr (LCP) family protein